MTRYFILLLALVAQSIAATYTTDADPTAAEVQTLIDGAADGDTIQIVAGSFTWTTSLTVSGKGINIVGAGGGKLAGCSKTSLAIGTGTKVFTVHTATNGQSLELNSALYGFAEGETIRAIYKADGTKYMEGTVVSYTGNTLTLDVTSTGGSGTLAAWTFYQTGQTTITWNSTGTMLSVVEDATHSTTLSEIDFISTFSTGAGSKLINISGSGKPFIWHDGVVDNNDGMRIIEIRSSNKGLLYNLGWHTGWRFGAVEALPGYGLVNVTDSNTTSWNEPSKIGAADTDGTGNVYLENCYFAGMLTETFDSDGGSRLAVRRCVFDNSGTTSHGADTGPIGNRHVQFVENLLVFENLGTDTAAMDYFFYGRGGTGIVVGNVIPNITSSEYGDKNEFRLTVQNLQRSSGPNPLWGKDISGAQYPAPRQIGMGRITGTGNAQFPTPPYEDSITYAGDSEPWYQWGNSGTGNYATPSIENYEEPTAGEDTAADYIQIGRDWINDTHPTYTPYTYPHPLRSVAPSTRNPGRKAKAGRVIGN